MHPVEDASGYTGYADQIVIPASEGEVLSLLRQQTPVTIAGAGTGVTGGRVPQGGRLLSLEKLSRIEIQPGRAIAGPGASLRDLQSAAASTGQFYAPDPTEWTASVGGTIATNASGSRSFRYGDTRQHVLRIRVALMDGRVLDVRRGDQVDFEVQALPIPRTTKHTAGYRMAPGMDWIDLFVGSEGTLGVVLEAELRLLPAPKSLLGGVVFFATDDEAQDAVDSWRHHGPRMLEYLDAPSLDLLRLVFPEIPAQAQAALLIEQEDIDPDLWLDRLESAKALLEGSWFGETATDRERFRRFRHALPERVNDTVRKNGLMKLGSDYAVPIDRNREMMREYRTRLPQGSVVFGHIGDAHVHANILPATQEEFARGQQIMLDLARCAVALGGTVSAEHGLGKRKAHLLALQYSPEQIEFMKQVKRRLDPHWLLGQGTLFPNEARS